MLLFGGLMVHSVLVSHRIAGPLYQFRRLFGELREGRRRVRATLRKRDYLRKEATAFNEMVVSLEARTATVHTQAAGLNTGVRALRIAIDDGADEQYVNNNTFPTTEAELADDSEFHLSGSVSFSRFDAELKNGVMSMHMHVEHIGSANGWHANYPGEGSVITFRKGKFGE